MSIVQRPGTSAVARTSYLRSLRTLEREITVDALPVQGSVPAWLAGTLVRNGAARFEVGRDRYRHWFDGSAMLHRFTFAGGHVGYANRYLQSPGYRASQKAGKITHAEFATDPRLSLLERIGRIGRDPTGHNANVTVFDWGETMLAFTETPCPIAFDLATLHTLGLRRFDDDVPVQIATAHLQHDRARGLAYNAGTQIGRKSQHHVTAIVPGTFTRTCIGSIAVDKPGYFHSFASTENYVIVAVFPFVVDPLALAIRRKPFRDNFRWEPERNVRFFVVAKDGGGVVGSYETAAFFGFHHVNAYEERDTIVLDISAYPDDAIVDAFSLEQLADPTNRVLGSGELRRYRLIPGASVVRGELLSSALTELPSVNPRVAGRPYRYAYAVDATDARPTPLPDALVRVDVVERTELRWTEPGAIPGEPIFVARPGAVDEDDGVLLSVVYDDIAGASYLLLLDARTLTEIARADVPHIMPLGFHGVFRADDRGANS